MLRDVQASIVHSAIVDEQFLIRNYVSLCPQGYHTAFYFRVHIDIAPFGWLIDTSESSRYVSPEVPIISKVIISIIISIMLL